MVSRIPPSSNQYSSDSQSSNSSTPDADTAAILKQINDFRAQHGKGPLTWNTLMANQAKQNDDAELKNGTIGHNFPNRNEITAEGQTSLAQALTDWYNSPEHRDLLLGDFKGVGMSHEGNYWTMDFV